MNFEEYLTEAAGGTYHLMDRDEHAATVTGKKVGSTPDGHHIIHATSRKWHRTGGSNGEHVYVVHSDTKKIIASNTNSDVKGAIKHAKTHDTKSGNYWSGSSPATNWNSHHASKEFLHPAK